MIPLHIKTIAWLDLLNAPPAVADTLMHSAKHYHVGHKQEIDLAFDAEIQASPTIPTGRQIYQSFQNTRDALRHQYGDTMTLFRAQSKQNLIPDKHTLNYASKEEAQDYLVLDEDRELLIVEIPVDDVIAMNVGWNNNYEELIVRNHESEGGIDLCAT